MSEPVWVTLTDDEFRAAWAAGEARHRHHSGRLRRPNTVLGLRQEGIGAVAEAAVAKALGGRWNDAVGRNHYGTEDVVTGCGGLEIKATHHATGRLLVYTDTPDDTPVVMVQIVEAGAPGYYSTTLKLVGWIYARHGKRPEWWQAAFKTPCFAVPQDKLRPIGELPCTQPSSSS